MIVQNYDIQSYDDETIVCKDMMDLSERIPSETHSCVELSFELDNFQSEETDPWTDGSYLAGINVVVGHEVRQFKTSMKHNKRLDKFLLPHKNQQTLDSFLHGAVSTTCSHGSFFLELDQH